MGKNIMCVDEYIKSNGHVFWAHALHTNQLNLEYDETVGGGGYKYPKISGVFRSQKKDFSIEDAGDMNNISLPADINPRFPGWSYDYFRRGMQKLL